MNPADTPFATNKAIVQSVLFEDSAEELFDAYLDPARHAARNGRGAVVVSAQPGAEFKAFDGGLHGRMISVLPKRLIVQSWRATTDKWKASDPDSLLLLAFSDQSKGHGRIDLMHVGVPPAAFELISEGWKQHYWNAWGGRLVRTRETHQ